MRIVTTTCSNTEIVCALGKSDWLVGTDDHSDYPESVVAALPRVGPDLSVDPERISALKPDLVLASLTVPGHEEVVASLESFGLPVAASEPVSLDDVHEDILNIATRMNCEREGKALVAEMRDAMPARNRSGNTPSLLVQWWPKPVIGAARQSWVHDMIELAGGRNALADLDCKSQPMTDGDVAALNPDAIIIAWCGVKPEKYRPEVVYRNPAFAEMTAVREQRVFCIPEAHLGRPSPRLIDGYRDLCDVIDQLS